MDEQRTDQKATRWVWLAAFLICTAGAIAMSWTGIKLGNYWNVISAVVLIILVAIAYRTSNRNAQGQ